MHLYINDKMVKIETDAAALEQALVGFIKASKGSLELRRSPEEWLRATRDQSGFCSLEISSCGSVIGMGIDREDLGEVRAVFQEFVRGYQPSLPWKKLSLLGDQGDNEFVVGDPHHDGCPLCRLLE
ncbi:MAG: hypothetical protein ABIJ96_08260 [Elusimicrobiota bacterium]